MVDTGQIITNCLSTLALVMDLASLISTDHMTSLRYCWELDPKPANPSSFGGWRGAFREGWNLTQSWQEWVLSAPTPIMWELAVTKGEQGL
jgi:hypothetical protein